MPADEVARAAAEEYLAELPDEEFAAVVKRVRPPSPAAEFAEILKRQRKGHS